MNIYETIRTAILAKKACEISKLAEPERKVCPYLLGKSSGGVLNVLFYQYDGYSKGGLKEKGSTANWRCARILDIASAEIIDEDWHAPNQKPKVRGTCVASIDAEVEGYY
jgi:hypothetical protein